MKKSLITLLSLTALMSATFVSAETPTTATTETTTTQSSTIQDDNTPVKPDETIRENGEQVETFSKDNMINNGMNSDTETDEGQNWLELPNSDEWRYNGFEGHKSLTPPTTTQSASEQAQTVPQQTTTPQATTPQATTTQQPEQETAQVNNEPTAQQIKNATKEPSVFALDTLPQTGNKDTLGDVLEVLGFAVLIGLAVYISYSPIKRKLNSDKN